MENSLPTTFLNKNNKIIEKINNFYYSNYYIIILTLVTFLFWYLNLSVVGMSILLILNIVSLVCNRDVSPTIPLLPLMVISVSNSSFLKDKYGIVVIAVLGSLFLISLFFNLYHFKQKFKKTTLSFSLFLVSCALLLSGIGFASIKDYLKGLDYAMYLGPLMLLLFLFYSSCTNVPKHIDSKRYFSKLFTTISVICIAQLIVAHLRIDAPIIEHFRAYLDVGWSNRNGISLMLVLGMSTAFYLAETAKRFNFIWYNVSVLIYIAIILTTSRGGIIFGTFEITLISIYLFARSSHKKQFVFAFLCWLAGVIVIIATHTELIASFLDKFKELGFNTTGRTALYKEGFILFKIYPLFGVGFGYRGVNFTVPLGCTYWFHSTPIQIMASTGLFGVVCYSIFYVDRIKVFFKYNNNFNNMIFITFITYEFYNFIDAGAFEPFPFVFVLIMLNWIVDYTNKEEEDIENKKHIHTPQEEQLIKELDI